MAVADNVTAQALLKLYMYLSELGQSILYCDTDSVIFLQNLDELPKVRTSDYPCHLTDELEEFRSCFFVQEFVSNGTKNYAFSIF